MNSCYKCSAEITPEMKFCAACGTEQGGAASMAKSKNLSGRQIIFAVLGVFGGAFLLLQFTPMFRTTNNGITGEISRAIAPPITMEKYLKIQEGMSYSQVVEIIGEQGVEMSRNRMEGVPGVMESIETAMYGWQNPDGSNMNAMFQNDKLIQRAQFGLK